LNGSLLADGPFEAAIIADKCNGDYKLTDSVIEPVVNALAGLSGMEAIVLGGSRARGDASPNSDYDLGLYYHAETPFHVEALEDAVRPLVDAGTQASLTPIGEWGPWIIGGGWLKVQAKPVDLLYRNLDAVETVLQDALDGKLRIDYQPGHPHGFVSTIWLAEVHYALPLYDPNGTLMRLKSRLDPYPRFQWEIGFSIGSAVKALDRGDPTYVAGALFQALVCAGHVICAINGTHVMNEKGLMRLAAAQRLKPERFAERVTAIWAHFGTGDTKPATNELAALDREIAALVDQWR
jgi:predicted nucleotidyltransferase